MATPAACAARVGEARCGAVDQHIAGVGLDHARENVHQRRLAGPDLAEQRVDLAAIEIEVDPAERLDAAEALDHSAHGEERRGTSSFVHRALAQESRTIRVVVSRSDRGSPSGAAIRSIKRAAARLPISW